ncbi:MAG: tetratricopeptide repeat protein [Prevotella sp.]|nr:tetratricopeptide repeat protein [Prevotella sp.]MCI6447526.1 tetratricopeptide repeat protein [Prevotella sp.]MCI7268934.1 tetratricopeptide repeat protein [Prevotella sp.]MCI7496655.1 tetratricopeptide repeat protein [Prevotella sp.]MDD6992524.1 tetratricopeptide repeat protein [Prevotella sp.]
MNLPDLIKHPEKLNKETLYDLRSLVALYPYYQPARLLMLRNLYLLHDPTFDEELRRAAVYITDRRVIFNLVEAAHYKLKRPTTKVREGNRTVTLIDSFLSSIPAEQEENNNDNELKDKKKTKRKPTAADATVDYVSYLLATDFEDEDDSQDEDIAVAENNPSKTNKETNPSTPMNGMQLIDKFINDDGGKLTLKDNPEFVPQLEDTNSEGEKVQEEEYFTETLAGIYIKQGKYSKALEIIKRLNLNYPKKNAYFADQMRFLEKLILNDKSSKRR